MAQGLRRLAPFFLDSAVSPTGVAADLSGIESGSVAHAGLGNPLSLAAYADGCAEWRSAAANTRPVRFTTTTVGDGEGRAAFHVGCGASKSRRETTRLLIQAV